MPQKKYNEKRKYDRYETDVKIDFYVAFDVRTKIDFRVKDPKEGTVSSQKYSGISKNISAEGISFTSEKELIKGDSLLLDVFVPTAKQPVRMEGLVRWCRELSGKSDKVKAFEYGIRLLKVDGSSVEKSIVNDPVHNIIWSVVLESVLGNFKHLVLKDRKRFTSSFPKT